MTSEPSGQPAPASAPPSDANADADTGPLGTGLSGAMPPSSSVSPEHRKGLLITFLGGLIISFDTPLIRLADSPQWTVMFWRTGFTVLSMGLVWLVLQLANKRPPPLVNGWPGLSVSLLYALGNLSFITAVYNTSIANVVVILAMTPLIAGVISFLWFRERLPLATWAALVTALIGVAVIVHAGIGEGTLFGDAMAALTAASLALAFTLARRSGRNLVMATLTASLIVCLVSLAMAATLYVPWPQWWYIAVNGLIVIPLSFSLLTLGPRYISSAEVSLFLLLETILAPIWVWLVVGEKIPPATQLGGAIIVGTLIIHSLHRLRRS